MCTLNADGLGRFAYRELSRTIHRVWKLGDAKIWPLSGNKQFLLPAIYLVRSRFAFLFAYIDLPTKHSNCDFKEMLSQNLGFRIFASTKCDVKI